MATQTPNPFNSPQAFKAARLGEATPQTFVAAKATPVLAPSQADNVNAAPPIVQQQTQQVQTQSRAQIPNPFVDPQGFTAMRFGNPPIKRVEISQEGATAPQKALEVGVSSGLPTEMVSKLGQMQGRQVNFYRSKEAPNPFVYPKDFEAQRRLTQQISSSQPKVDMPTVIPDASVAPKEADPLLSAPPEFKKKEEKTNPFLNPVDFQEARLKAKAIWENTIATIQEIAVAEVAMELGGLGGQDGDPNKYKVKGDNVQLTGQRWYNFNSDRGGVGPISMVMDFENIERKDDAIRWLALHFKDRINNENIKASAYGYTEKQKVVFEPPENAPHFLDAIRNYLHKERGIEKDLIERLISDGRLYADPHRNVVMISKTGEVAELRGIEAYQDRRTGEMKTTKMLKPGSKKDSGAFMIPPDKEKVKNKQIKAEKSLAVVEAGIDAMSYHMLNPSRAVASASGASFSYPRKLFFQAYDSQFEFHCAFDADSAGDKASQNIFNSALLFDHFRAKNPQVVRDTNDFMKLIKSKVLRLKLRPELHTSEKTEDESDDDSLDEGMMENVLFFSSHNPFEYPDQPPVVKYQVMPNKLGLEKGSFEIQVTPDIYNKIIKEFKLFRDRPEHVKDWNELVKPKTTNLPKFT